MYVERSLAMASPEIVDLTEDDLGRVPEGTVFDDESKANSRDNLTTKSTEKDQQENVLDKSTPIIYHYLKFETNLPSPSTSISVDPAKPSPPQPDLKKFTSPFDWPESRKNLMVWLSCIATLTTAYTAGAYSPAVDQMTVEWNVSQVAAVVGITSFCCGFGIAPMVLAPFSEIQGRYPVTNLFLSPISRAPYFTGQENGTCSRLRPLQRNRLLIR